MHAVAEIHRLEVGQHSRLPTLVVIPIFDASESSRSLYSAIITRSDSFITRRLWKSGLNTNMRASGYIRRSFAR